MKKFLLGSLFALIGLIPFHAVAKDGDTTEDLDTPAYHCGEDSKDLSTTYEKEDSKVRKNSAG